MSLISLLLDRLQYARRCIYSHREQDNILEYFRHDEGLREHGGGTQDDRGSTDDVYVQRAPRRFGGFLRQVGPAALHHTQVTKNGNPRMSLRIRLRPGIAVRTENFSPTVNFWEEIPIT